jgi:hypothetical protein
MILSFLMFNISNESLSLQSLLGKLFLLNCFILVFFWNVSSLRRFKEFRWKLELASGRRLKFIYFSFHLFLFLSNWLLFHLYLFLDRFCILSFFLFLESLKFNFRLGILCWHFLLLWITDALGFNFKQVLSYTAAIDRAINFLVIPAVFIILINS